MADDSKFSIRLHIYDADIPVNIPRQDEAMYRRAAKLITDRLNAYSSFYKGRKETKEINYMALIDIALMYERERSRSDSEPFVKSMKKITQEIESEMNKDK